MGWTLELPDAVRKVWTLEEDMIILFAGFGYREHRDSERAGVEDCAMHIAREGNLYHGTVLELNIGLLSRNLKRLDTGGDIDVLLLLFRFNHVCSALLFLRHMLPLPRLFRGAERRRDELCARGVWK
jgi:hypothetical protein